jgi:signal transduction histidine kinase
VARSRAAQAEGDAASLLTTLSGRVVSADPSAVRLLNCPSRLLTGSFFPSFVREPSPRELPAGTFVTTFAEREWAGVIQPLHRPAVPVTIQVAARMRPDRPGPAWARRALSWTLSPRGGAAPARPSRATEADRAHALEEAARRLGRELHDEAGQLLAVAHLALDGLRCSAGCPTQERLPQLKGILERVEHELRRLSHDLRPPLLESLGLGASVRELAMTTEARHGVPVTVTDTLHRRLPPECELHLFRIVQEALTNAARHAAAEHIVVRLGRSQGVVVVEIVDDGRGMPVPDKKPCGLGLMTMAERAVLLGGSLDIVTRPGGGTAVRVLVGPRLVTACAS